MSTTPRTNPPERKNDRHGEPARRAGASSRTIKDVLSAAIPRQLRRNGRKIEPNPRPISREVDF